MTRSEAGRLGGKATFQKYGSEHFSRIGKAGFAALREKYGFENDCQVLSFLYRTGAKMLIWSPDRHDPGKCLQCAYNRIVDALPNLSPDYIKELESEGW